MCIRKKLIFKLKKNPLTEIVQAIFTLTRWTLKKQQFTSSYGDGLRVISKTRTHETAAPEIIIDLANDISGSLIFHVPPCVARIRIIKTQKKKCLKPLIRFEKKKFYYFFTRVLIFFSNLVQHPFDDGNVLALRVGRRATATLYCT